MILNKYSLRFQNIWELKIFNSSTSLNYRQKSGNYSFLKNKIFDLYTLSNQLLETLLLKNNKISLKLEFEIDMNGNRIVL